MGHESFYNSLISAMGNILSSIFMFILQAAWLCQRLLDQDYRQNHGSRLAPVLSNENSTVPTEFDSLACVLPNHKTKSTKPKLKKVEIETNQTGLSKSNSFRSKKCHQNRITDSSDRLNSSHPYLEGLDSMSTTIEYINGLGQNLKLRRAFSDINISSNNIKFSSETLDYNKNFLSNRNLSETTGAMTDQDFLRLIFTKGYVI